MNSVWVIEQGQYSDYRVVGVFSSKVNAEMICNVINKSPSTYDKATIAEWPLDPAVAELNEGMRQYEVWMLKDGRVEQSKQEDELTFSPYLPYVWKRSKIGGKFNEGKPDMLRATVWARDAEHAIKIVNEIRTRMIADGEWE